MSQDTNLLISFVMPTHNRERYIGEAIQTIIDQEYTNWELIVIDDHSDPEDKTEQIVAGFNEPRIRYYKLPDKHGRNSPSARNFGNALATGEVIAIADSDDLFYPNRARLIAESYLSEGWDVFYANFDVWDQTTDSYVSLDTHPIIPFDKEKLKQYNFIPHGSAAYRRTVARNNPYNSFMTRSSDYDLFTRLAEAGKKFYFCPEKVYRYRLHGANLIKQYSGPLFDTFLREGRGWLPFNPETAQQIVEN